MRFTTARVMRPAGALGVAAIALTMFSHNVAAAVSWSPQSTVEQATLKTGTNMVMTDNKGNTVTCTSLSNGTTNSYVEAPVGGNAAVAGSVNSTGGSGSPQFSGCSNSFAPSFSTTVTASGQWKFTATSTTSVDVSNASATIQIGSGFFGCTITVSNASVTGNTWSNSTSQLTLNSTASFSISESGVCDGATSSKEAGTLQLPTSVQIV